MKRFAFLAIPFVFAACGDNKAVEQPIDAPIAIDSPEIDAPPPIDARDIDAPPPQTFSGTVTIFEATLKNMGGAGVDGHGVQIGISFVDNLTALPPVAASPGATETDGCLVWKYTVPQLLGTAGTDQGAVTITHTPMGGSATTFAGCVFTPAGYVCPDPGSSGTGGGTLAAGPLVGTSIFTVPSGAARFHNDDRGRYLRLTDSAMGPFDGKAFPIMGIVGTEPSMTAIVATGAAQTATLPATVSFTTLAGVGPIPDPTFNPLGNSDTIRVTKTGTSPAVNDFSMVLAGADVGDSFTLGTGPSVSTPTLNKVLPTTVPTDGSEFVVGCDDGAACGTSLGQILNIVTTDATPTSAFDFPVGNRTQIRCVKIGGNEIRVPAAISDYLKVANSGAKKMQVTFIRTNLASPPNDTTPPTSSTRLLSGHAEVGFVTYPP